MPYWFILSVSFFEYPWLNLFLFYFLQAPMNQKGNRASQNVYIRIQILRDCFEYQHICKQNGYLPINLHIVLSHNSEHPIQHINSLQLGQLRCVYDWKHVFKVVQILSIDLTEILQLFFTLLRNVINHSGALLCVPLYNFFQEVSESLFLALI